ncbi:hypothetical protein MKQ68_23755 [Chitinophaga horti]|uniref:Beta-carotene 15,15'-monooxygenase n=1 Tax=Chitinophaga horti TaxID=2920382 RepID=A0ABY6J446_9BACT|nr:hypothetical protein [Chitinophaga horti]UYQ93101.1 hypothetical protein MKQ68_23755 [Chitinophaga horti]
MNEQQHLDTLTDIKRMMERSTRFISLSGLSGIIAGAAAIAGGAVAFVLIRDYYYQWDVLGNHSRQDFLHLKVKLMVLALAVLVIALTAGCYLTWRRARRNGEAIWDGVARKVLVNLAIPLVAGGAFVMGSLYNEVPVLIAPVCLIFYGLALVNASKYTLSDIRYLGLVEIALGIVNLFAVRYGLYFWVLGFGVLHIVYGTSMWWKYERGTKVS